MFGVCSYCRLWEIDEICRFRPLQIFTAKLTLSRENTSCPYKSKDMIHFTAKSQLIQENLFSFKYCAFVKNHVYSLFIYLTASNYFLIVDSYHTRLMCCMCLKLTRKQHNNVSCHPSNLKQINPVVFVLILSSFWSTL